MVRGTEGGREGGRLAWEATEVGQEEEVVGGPRGRGRG